MPKPKGELRLEYPTPTYTSLSAPCPFTFEYSTLAQVVPTDRNCWFGLNYKGMKATVFISHYPLTNNLVEHIKDAEKLVYEHTVKASAIETKSFSYSDKKVYGNFYRLQGHSASNVQFYITDSTRNFISGNLYFKARPQPDSLAPAVQFIENDIRHLIETFEWKKQ